jgi:hypothetical protein
MLQDFQFKIIHRVGSQHLNIDALNKNLVDFPKEDEDFGCNVMEQEDKPRVTPSPIESDFANEVVINLFILQHIDQETNDAKAHLVGSECDGQSVDSFSEEKLSPINHVKYRRTVVEIQNMEDEAKDRHKCKSVEIVIQCEDDQLRQMDIWENKVLIVFLTSGNLEAKIYDSTNIKKAKKQVIKYHWSKIVFPRIWWYLGLQKKGC